MDSGTVMIWMGTVCPLSSRWWADRCEGTGEAFTGAMPGLLQVVVRGRGL